MRGESIPRHQGWERRTGTGFSGHLSWNVTQDPILSLPCGHIPRDFHVSKAHACTGPLSREDRAVMGDTEQGSRAGSYLPRGETHMLAVGWGGVGRAGLAPLTGWGMREPLGAVLWPGFASSWSEK